MDGIEKLVVGAIVVCSNRVLLLTRADGEFMSGLVELPSGGLVESASDDVSLNHEEHANYQWLDISLAPFEEMNMSTATRKSITAALKPLEGEINYVRPSVLDHLEESIADNEKLGRRQAE